MIWLKKKQRPTEELTVTKINFIGEQDGIPEQNFKTAINILLKKHENILSAFLARVDYGNPEEFNVALCIRSNEKDNVGFKKEAGEIFSAQFGAQEHLDIVFLRKEQEADIRKICSPFYEK